MTYELASWKWGPYQVSLAELKTWNSRNFLRLSGFGLQFAKQLSLKSKGRQSAYQHSHIFRKMKLNPLLWKCLWHIFIHIKRITRIIKTSIWKRFYSCSQTKVDTVFKPITFSKHYLWAPSHRPSCSHDHYKVMSTGLNGVRLVSRLCLTKFFRV